MQTTPDFMSADEGADPSMGDPSAAAGGDPSQAQAGGGFMDSMDDAGPQLNVPDDGADQNLGDVQHGATMGGNNAQYAGTDTMLTQDETQVSPEEQKAYDDFVTRGLLFMNDTRKPLGKGGKTDETAKSPADIIIDHLNIKGMPADQAVGRTTAQICWLIYTNALHQNIKYPPDVVYHAADEIMSHVYEIGVQSGAIQNPPPADSPQEQKLLGMAKMYATQFFGNNVLDAGLGDRDANKQFYMDQMKREADSGAYEHWNPAEQMSPDQLSGFISRASQGKAALASLRARAPSSIGDFQKRGTPSLVPPGGAPQPQQAAPADDGSGGGDPSQEQQ